MFPLEALHSVLFFWLPLCLGGPITLNRYLEVELNTADRWGNHWLIVCAVSCRWSLRGIKEKSSFPSWTRPSSWCQTTSTWVNSSRSSGRPQVLSFFLLTFSFIPFSPPHSVYFISFPLFISPHSAMSLSPHQEAPPAELKPGFLPAGQRPQHGLCVGCHLRGLRTGAGPRWLPLHGVRLPGDLWHSPDRPVNSLPSFGQSVVFSLLHVSCRTPLAPLVSTLRT